MSVINPGSVTLSTWRDIYQGGKASLDPSCLDAVARSAAFVAQIAAKDQAVYGINTGFGLLASIGIAPEDLQTLQRNCGFRRSRASIPI